MPRKTFSPAQLASLFTLAAFSTGQRVAADDKGDLPDRLLVVPWGENKTRKGLVVCNATTVAELANNQAREKFDRVAFDFDHNTVKPGIPEPKKVAGYGTPEIVDGEGVYLSAIEYTADGKELLAGGHYPDISPAVLRNAKGEVIFLHSVGACRQGEIDGLTLFSAGETPRLSCFAAIDDMDADDDEADDEEPTGLRGIVVMLLKALGGGDGLTDDSNDGDLAAAAKAAITAMKGEADAAPAAFAARMDKIETLLTDHRRDSLISKAVAEGKVIPLSAEMIKTVDLTVLSAVIENTPVTVPLESRLGGAIDDFSATGPHITPEAREVAALLNLDPKDLV
jgi:hypothetical protein